MASTEWQPMLSKQRVLEILQTQRELLTETEANGGDFSIDDIIDIIEQVLINQAKGGNPMESLKEKANKYDEMKRTQRRNSLRYQKLGTLCRQWVEANHPKVFEALFEQATREAEEIHGRD